MRYMGSKFRIANDVAGLINELAHVLGLKDYYETFVGGASVIEQVTMQNRYGSDINKYTIAMLKEIQEHGVENWPATLPKEQYNEVRQQIRDNPEAFEDWYIFWVGNVMSFNGVWFNGYGGTIVDKDGRVQDKGESTKRGIVARNEQSLLRGVSISVADYKELDAHNSIIYCDPPYINTEGYSNVAGHANCNTSKATDEFNHAEFYTWCEEMAQDNLVLISEYYMPADRFNCIAEFKLPCTLGALRTDNIDRTEKVFVVKGGKYTDLFDTVDDF